MKINQLLLIILLFNFFNCGNKEIQYEEKLLRNLVRKYLVALMDTYRDFNLEHLEGITAEGEKRRIDVLILTMRMENKYLDASIKELRFVKIVKIDNFTYEVWTEEKWSYLHRDLKTRLPVDIPKEANYRMVYTIKKGEKNWMVYYVDFVDSRTVRKKDIFEEYQEFLKEQKKRK